MRTCVERSWAVAPIVVEVETSVGSGAFAVDDRLRVEWISLGSDHVISTARVSVRLDDSFDVFDARQR